MNKGTYRPKIPRKKIPNLLNIYQKQLNSKTEWPTFFNKIQNSFKLLQQPIQFNIPKSNKNKYLSYRQTISLRLKQLSKPKQRNISLTQTQLITNQNKFQKKIFLNMNQYSHPNTSVPTSKFSSSFKPISLPFMNNLKSNKNYSLQQKVQSQDLPRRPIQKGQRSIQEIAATTLLQKSFQQILALHKQQVYKQFDEYLQNQNNQEVLPSKPSPKQIQSVGRKNSKNCQVQIKSPKQESIRISNHEEDQFNNLTQISDMIIGGQPKIYQVLDKKLMEKIKLHRSRKPFRFNHQVMWKS